MKISIKDASSYFRGLLLLIRKDKRVDHSEVDLMKRVGKSLGFEPRFCENAIHEILESTYIAETPIAGTCNQIRQRRIDGGAQRQLHGSGRGRMAAIHR